MTMYFPLVVHGAMLIEPTESESKGSLDSFIHVLREMALEARDGKTARFAGAPRLAPRRRLDETQAARKPVLRLETRRAQARGRVRVVTHQRAK
jgi:glycine dehydrogenase subunit 2